MLHENQLMLLNHLGRFQMMDYPDCLRLLDTAGTGDLVALSYAFRPLTRNRYLSKRKDGCVTILKKGRDLFPDVKPLISTGGGSAERKRVMAVSRMAALMEKNGIPCLAGVPDSAEPCFIPSACWRAIAPGILSTTRFLGMLLADAQRIAVYDIGDGRMEWQVRAESSLFYTKYGTYATKATGMLLICREDARDAAAEHMIRQTMWNRRQLLSNHYAERDKPVRWSKSPIKLRAQYEHVYLSTPSDIKEDMATIFEEDARIREQCGEAAMLHDPAQGDYEDWPCRFRAPLRTDLPGEGLPDFKGLSRID